MQRIHDNQQLEVDGRGVLLAAALGQVGEATQFGRPGLPQCLVVGGGGCYDPLPLAFTKPSGLPRVDPTICNMQKLFCEQVIYHAPKYKRVSADK